MFKLSSKAIGTQGKEVVPCVSHLDCQPAQATYMMLSGKSGSPEIPLDGAQIQAVPRHPHHGLRHTASSFQQWPLLMLEGCSNNRRFYAGQQLDTWTTFGTEGHWQHQPQEAGAGQNRCPEVAMRVNPSRDPQDVYGRNQGVLKFHQNRLRWELTICPLILTELEWPRKYKLERGKWGWEGEPTTSKIKQK